MGYSIKIIEIDLVLDQAQQKKVEDVWTQLCESIELKTRWFKSVEEDVKKRGDYNIRTFLDVLGFDYLEENELLIIKGFQGKMYDQRNLFEEVAFIVTPGNYIQFRGEDGDEFGWFFNGQLISIDSQEDLNHMKYTFSLHKDLNQQLTSKEVNIKKAKV